MAKAGESAQALPRLDPRTPEAVRERRDGSGVAVRLLAGRAVPLVAEQREALAPLPLPPRTTVPAPHADSLAWTVQLTAYGSLDKALALADRLRAAEVEAFVTPIAQEGRRTVWYRVLAGAYPTHDQAAAARAALWLRGLAPRGEGELLRAPYSFRLAEASDPDSLRRQGVPAVRWGSGNQVFVGAFETREQASLTEAQLARVGLQATLIIRMGTTP